jgi:hypothetical protein
VSASLDNWPVWPRAFDAEYEFIVIAKPENIVSLKFKNRKARGSAEMYEVIERDFLIDDLKDIGLVLPEILCGLMIGDIDQHDRRGVTVFSDNVEQPVMMHARDMLHEIEHGNHVKRPLQIKGECVMNLEKAFPYKSPCVTNIVFRKVDSCYRCTLSQNILRRDSRTATQLQDAHTRFDMTMDHFPNVNIPSIVRQPVMKNMPLGEILIKCFDMFFGNHER